MVSPLALDDAQIDLLEDCREVNAVVGLPARPVTAARGAVPVDISPQTAARVAGWSEYGA